MAWETFSSVANVGGYGNAMLQYDDSSTGTLRNCRLQFELNPGASIYVYFNNVVISGGQVSPQVLVTGTATIWSGQLTAGRNESFSFTCPWSTGSVTYSGSGTLPSGSTAPTGLTVTDEVATTDSITATISVTGWGGAGSSSTRQKALNICTAQSTSNRRYELATGSQLSDTFTVTNNSTLIGSCTITANNRYYILPWATNGSQSTTNLYYPILTPPYAPSVTIVSVSGIAATFRYSIQADAGVMPKTLEHSIDNGTTWAKAVKITGGDATTGTFTITTLTPETQITMLTRINTGAHIVDGPTLQFETRKLEGTTFYGSVNDDATRVASLYGSVNSQSAFIIKVYGSDNGLTKRIY